MTALPFPDDLIAEIVDSEYSIHLGLQIMGGVRIAMQKD
jgi:hypothetical protein